MNDKERQEANKRITVARSISIAKERAEKKTAICEICGGINSDHRKIAGKTYKGKKCPKATRKEKGENGIMKTITLQPKERKDMVLPYPYFIDVKTAKVGRQDFWKGKPLKLICFAMKGATQSSLLFKDFVKNPKACVGLYPVFEEKDGEWYTYKDPIANVSVK